MDQENRKSQRKSWQQFGDSFTLALDWRCLKKAFEFKGTTGFVIAIDMMSKDVKK
jgi:hypothetical protein